MSLTAMARLTGSQDTNQIRLSDQSLCSQQVILTHKAHGPRPLRPLESVNNLRQVKVAHDRRRPATIHLSAKNTTGARAITPVNKTKIVSSLSSPKNQPSAIIKSTESQSLSGQSLRGKLQAAGNCKPSGLRRFIPPSPASLPRSSSRLSKALPENGSMITNARRSLEVSNRPDRRSISPGSNTLSSSLQSNSTVRPSRAASSARGSLDMMETSSKIKAKERAPTAISDNAVSAVRSKRLSSMKGKNERILASINAHLSPPTSPPNSHQISEPPLPSPPSSSSSRETCHSSSSTSPIRTVPVTISQPSAPLHISTPESEGTESFSESRSLSVPGSINGRPSGLIPFAAGCSPSPRKISVDPQGLSDPLNAEPKAQLDVTGFEDEDAEDARLGSVRGKRAERTRLLKRLSPAVEANSCETVSKGIIGLEEKIDQGVDRGERLKYQISEIVSHEESIVKTNVQRSEADRSLLGTRSGQVRAHDKRDPIVREASRMSACPEDGEEHVLRAQALRTWQKSHAVIDGHLHQRRDSIDRQTQISIMSDEEHESFSEGSAGHHQRLGSGSTSRHTSSSDTIGKTDFPTRELDSDLIEKDFLPIDQDHQHSSRWAEEEEDMPTPVKAHAGRLRALRHTSSVSELMMSKSFDEVDDEAEFEDGTSTWTSSKFSSSLRRTSSVNGRRYRLSLTEDPLTNRSIPPNHVSVRNSSDSRSTMRMTQANSRSSHSFYPDYSDNQTFDLSSTLNNSQPSHTLPAMGTSYPQIPPSPPPSHLSSSHRRQRPGLPQRFIKDSHTPYSHSDLDQNNPIDSRRFPAQQPPSPQANRKSHLPSRQSSLRYQSISNFDRYSQLGSSQRSDHLSGKLPNNFDRRSGVESALSHYDGHRNYGGRSYRPDSVRGKHSSWSEVEKPGLTPVRSQSVLGGVYDPRNPDSGQVRSRARHSMSPLAPRYTDPRAVDDEYEDEDDEQFSVTTYNNSNTLPRKTGSSGSRGELSEWGGDQDLNMRKSRLGSDYKLSERRVIETVRAVDSTPAINRYSADRDRTVRGSGGSNSGPRSTNNHSIKNGSTSYESSRVSYSGDRMSSSSGSSRRDTNSQRSGNRAGSLMSVLGSARKVPTMLTESVNRQARQSYQSNAVAGLLSPTPTVEHHKLLINAYEVLDQAQDSHSNESCETTRTLVGLLSSVVRNSCKIDATVKQLNEESLNLRVDLELAEDGNDNVRSDSTIEKLRQTTQKEPVDNKSQIMEANLAQMQKIHNQLLRTSNDHIRDLTEVLISLHKVHRSRERELMELRYGDGGRRSVVSSERRDSYDAPRESHYEDVRSISRTSRHHSPSRSPKKVMHPAGISPLSIISSHDESPLSRLNSKVNDPPLKRSQASESRHSSPLSDTRIKKHTQNHHRASTISFANDRNLLNSETPSGKRFQNRASVVSSRSINQHRDSYSKETSGETQALTNLYSRKSDLNEGDLSRPNEFGAFRRSTDNYSRVFERGLDQSEGSRRDTNGNRTKDPAVTKIRGSNIGSVFPRTPSRLATSSISQMTAHSNTSPTKALKESSLNRQGSRTERFVRPQSSMSHIIERANSVLSRVSLHQELQGPSVSCTNTGKVRERYPNEASVEGYTFPSRSEGNQSNSSARSRARSPSLADSSSLTESDMLSSSIQSKNGTWSGNKDLITRRGSKIGSTATAALERLSQISSWSGKYDDSESSNRRTISGAYTISPRDEEFDREGGDKWKGRRGRKASIQQLFGGLKRSSTVSYRK